MHTSSIFSECFNRSSDFKPYKKEERVLLISNLIKQRFQSIGRWSRRHHRRLFLWHAFNGQVLRLKSFLIAYEIHQINMEDSISLLQHIVRCHHVFFIVISYALLSCPAVPDLNMYRVHLRIRFHPQPRQFL